MNFFPVWALPVCNIASFGGTVPLVFIVNIYCEVSQTVWIIFSLSSWWISHPFSMYELPHFLQILIGSTDLILCGCHTYFLLLLLKLQPSLFLHTPRLRGQSHIFPSVEPKLSHFSLCECHTNILYRFSITPEWTM